MQDEVTIAARLGQQAASAMYKQAVARWRTPQGLYHLIQRFYKDIPRGDEITFRPEMIHALKQVVTRPNGSPSPPFWRSSVWRSADDRINQLLGDKNLQLWSEFSQKANRRLERGLSPELLFRGSTPQQAKNPWIGGYSNSWAHATPFPEVAKTYAVTRSPVIHGVLSVLKAHPQQRYYSDFGIEKALTGKVKGKKWPAIRQSAQPMPLARRLMARVAPGPLLRRVGYDSNKVRPMGYETAVRENKNKLVAQYLLRGAASTGEAVLQPIPDTQTLKSLDHLARQFGETLRLSPYRS